MKYSILIMKYSIFSMVILPVWLTQIHVGICQLLGGWGCLGEAKELCILYHRGVHLVFAYSWARPAMLAAGKERGGMFLFLLFLHFHSFSFSPLTSVSFPLLHVSLLSLFSLSLGDDTK